MISRRDFLVTSGIAVLGRQPKPAKTRVALVGTGIRGVKPATISFGQNLRADDLRRAAEAVEESDLAISCGLDAFGLPGGVVSVGGR